MKVELLIIHAKRYSLRDREDPRRLVEGGRIAAVDLGTKTEGDDDRGHEPILLPMPYNEFQKITVVPGIYTVDLVTRLREGKSVMSVASVEGGRGVELGIRDAKKAA